MALDAIYPLYETAHQYANEQEYQLAYDTFDRIKEEMEEISKNSKPEDQKMLDKMLAMINKEIRILEKEEASKKKLVNAVIQCATKTQSPDVPVDPLTWSAPPPKKQSPSSRKNSKAPSKGHARDDGKRVKNYGDVTGGGKGVEKKVNGKEEKSEEEKLEFGGEYDRHLVNIIEATRRTDTSVMFADISGNEGVKELFRQTVILPTVMPSYFKGIRRPWRGICLFGPPGTGKTMMARAMASEGKSTFFAVNCSDLASKWRGDSEKLVHILFEMARFHAPSIIFIDEIDTIGSQRGGSNEHEASRKVKSQLLTEMDGFEGDKDRVLVVSATNHPWDLDEALRRRFEKRIYVGLPDVEGRKHLIKTALKDVVVSEDVDVSEIASLTEGFSGADIRNVCRNAALEGVQRLTRGMAVEEMLEAVKGLEDQPLPVTRSHFEEALKTTNPSVTEASIARYDEWYKKYGSV